MCIDCSGIHRNLGVHISSVKSVTLDKWQPKWLDTVSKIGNRVGNEYYENRLPPNFRRPVHSDGVAAVENFIRSKYQRKDFVPDGLPAPHEKVANGGLPSGSNYGKQSSVGDVSPKPRVNTLNLITSSPKSPSPKNSFHESPKQSVQPSRTSDSFDLLGGLSPSHATRTTQQIQFAQPTIPTFTPPAFSFPSQPVAMAPRSPTKSRPVSPKSTNHAGFADIDPFAVFANRK
jgi:hypothetical protein